MAPRIAGGVALWCAVLLGVAVRPLEPTDPRVPAFLAVAASDAARSFAGAFADARIPAGFQIAEDENPGTLEWTQAARGKPETVVLSQVLDTFRAAHPGFTATIEAGVVVVRAHEVSADSANLLNRRVPEFAVVDLSLRHAFNAVRRVFEPSYPDEAGYMGSILGEPGQPKEIDWGPAAGISVRLQNVTVTDVLNAIVAQAPGTVWLVTYRDHTAAYFSSRIYYLRPGGFQLSH